MKMTNLFKSKNNDMKSIYGIIHDNKYKFFLINLSAEHIEDDKIFGSYSEVIDFYNLELVK